MSAEELDRLCKSFPGTTVDVKWGNDLCYLIGNKMYCVTHVEGPLQIAFKTTPEDFSMLIEREGIIPAPYTARYHWVLVEIPGALKVNEWKAYVEKSFRLVFEKLPQKVKRSL